MGTKLFSATSSGCDLWLIKMLLGQQHINAKGRWLCSLWPKAKESALKMTLVLLTTNKAVAETWRAMMKDSDQRKGYNY